MATPSSPLDFWKNTTVGDIWPYGRKIICFQHNDTVGECLRILEKKQIISAPVLKNNNLLGIVDTQQLLAFLLAIYPKQISKLDDLTSETFAEIIEKGKSFSNSTIEEVLELNRQLTNENEVFPVELSTPIEKLLDMFYLGVHRVPVISKDGSVFNVISQTDFLTVLAQCLPLLGDLNKQTIGSLGLTKGKILQVVEFDKPVISALSVLYHNRINAVPVVDEQGRIVANFSSSNLKDTNIYNFAEMLVGVKEFLSLQNLRPGSFLVKLQHQKALHPITCTLDWTFHSVVTEMVALKVHRIWVVGEDNKVTSVISLGDLFQVFLPWKAKNVN